MRRSSLNRLKIHALATVGSLAIGTFGNRSWTHRGRRCRSFVVILAVGLLAPTSVPAVAADDSPVIQVVGGTPVNNNTYPFVAALLNESWTTARSDFDKQFCGGSLIAENWVLTAAHCVDDGALPSTLSVLLGRTVLDSPAGEHFNVAEIVMHPGWDYETGLNYDVALVRLQGRSKVRPIRVATSLDSGYEQNGTMLTVAGWGNTLPNPGFRRSHRLRAVDIPVIGDEICRGAGSLWLCAGGTGKSACNGDSGGPLFATEPDGGIVQMASVSHGSYICDEGFGIYADLNDPDIRHFIALTAGV